MAWYRAGTVSITTGTTNVLGYNNSTQWINNAKPGHVFVGPDGLSYEISQVNQNTSITLASQYKGGSVSNVSYGGIIPTQIFVQELASQVEQLIQKYTLQQISATSTINVSDYFILGQGSNLVKVPQSTVLDIGNNPPGQYNLRMGSSVSLETITIDAKNYSMVRVVAVANTTKIAVGSLQAAPADPTGTSFREVRLVIEQGGGGSRVITWDTNIKHVPTNPVTSTLANSRDFFVLRSFNNGTTWYCFAEGGGVT